MKPLVVSYGMGVDSTAVLVGLHQRGERPDLVIFADTGSEKPETYAYLATINTWLESVGFPTVTVVKNPRPKSGDKSLEEACLRTGVLPALAYKFRSHQCSIVWKRDPIMAYCKRWAPAQIAWSLGDTVTMCIGYDAGPRDGCRRFKAEGKEQKGYTNRFPLIEWGWDRARCEAEIKAAGLPVPMKSACFFCPASKRSEIDWLAKFHPDLAQRAVTLENNAQAKLRTVKGLGSNFSWAEHLAPEGSS